MRLAIEDEARRQEILKQIAMGQSEAATAQSGQNLAFLGTGLSVAGAAL
jgi:hypothetical protein